MRKSTQKIVVLLSVACVLMALLDIISMPQVLRSYGQAAVLAGTIIASVLLMGWARLRPQNSRLVAILVILSTVVFQIITFLLLGLKLGFAKNAISWNLASITQIFLPLTIIIVAEEILRGQLVDKGRGSLPAVITTGVALWLIMVLVALPSYNLSEPKAIFTMLMVVAGPAILTNTLLTYIAYTYDYRINIAYRLIMDLPLYLLPIIPNSGVFLPALFQIGLVVSLILTLAVLNKANKGAIISRTATLRKNKSVRQARRIETEQAKRAKQTVKWIATGAIAAIAILYVGLMSGLFKFYFLAIGSGSMEPNLFRGDMILVEKSKDYADMKVGDVLVYHHSNVVMVHRIAEIAKDGNNYIFQTKGDNNASNDAWQVTQSDIIGLAKGKIAMFGYPTLWLNELFNQD